MKSGFTLIELLVVIAIVSLLMAIMTPTLSQVRQQAMSVVVNGELYGIGVALESYAIDNEGLYPPTRADCNPWARKHAYALPQELVDSGYLPKGEIGKVRFAKIEDKFNRGCAYKYIAVGPKYDYLGAPFGNQHLYIPEGFPAYEGDNLIKYNDFEMSPVTWVLFSLGPRYDIQSLENRDFPLKEGFPVSRRFWYSPETGEGILARMRLIKGRHIGSFEK
ncbi:MAG TPA: type II secretion system protein [Planctomycetes bacterium]|nr:type II secretion system protein [Planctomycetota bacterium]